MYKSAMYTTVYGDIAINYVDRLSIYTVLVAIERTVLFADASV